MRSVSAEEAENTDWAEVSPDVIEKDLTVVGCTGVEDELQEDVAECVTDLRAAGIKIWMLTGDQGRTAQEIGYNCGIISRDKASNPVYTIEGREVSSVEE